MNKYLWFLILILASITLEARHPRLNTSLQYGNTISLWIDTFLPPLVNEDTSVFIDFQQQYNGWTSGGDLAYVLSPGVGMRKKLGSQVVGAYLFADYFQSYQGKKFWGFGPGFDFYKGPFQLTLNTYLPIGKQERILKSNTVLTSITTEQVAPHEALQTSLYTTNSKKERLPYGFDFTGYYIPENKPYFAEAGFYYYNANHLKPTTGGRVAIGYFPLPYLKLKLEEKYDNHSHNRIVGSIEISLGGIFNGNLKSKLTYPIYRRQNLNTTKRGSTSEQSDFKQTIYKEKKELFERIWFVHGGTSSLTTTGSGTWEDPYTSLAYALSPGNSPQDANFWMTGDDSSTTLATLTGTQTLSGRTTDFQAPASTLSSFLMPKITTQSMIITSDNAIQDIQIYHTGSTTFQDAKNIENGVSQSTFNPVLLINASSAGSSNRATISNVVVKSKSAPSTSKKVVGIEINQGAATTLTSCEVDVSSEDGTHGVFISGGSFKASSSTIKASTSGSSDKGAAGITCDINDNSVVDCSNVDIVALSNSSSSSDYAEAIWAYETSTINLHGGSIGVTTTSGSAFGIGVEKISQLTISECPITVQSEHKQGVGIYLKDQTQANISNSIITSSSSSFYVVGVWMRNSSNLFFTGGSILSTGTPNVWGIYCNHNTGNNHLTVANCSITANSSLNHSTGISITNASQIANCTNVIVTATAISGWARGAYLNNNSSGNFSNSTFLGTTSGSGLPRGVSIDNATGTFNNCSILATATGSAPSSIACNIVDTSTGTFTNSTFSGTSSGSGEARGVSIDNATITLIGTSSPSDKVISSSNTGQSKGIHLSGLQPTLTISNYNVTASSADGRSVGIECFASTGTCHITASNSSVTATSTHGDVDAILLGNQTDFCTFENMTVSASSSTSDSSKWVRALATYEDSTINMNGGTLSATGLDGAFVCTVYCDNTAGTDTHLTASNHCIIHAESINGSATAVQLGVQTIAAFTDVILQASSSSANTSDECEGLRLWNTSNTTFIGGSISAIATNHASARGIDGHLDLGSSAQLTASNCLITAHSTKNYAVGAELDTDTVGSFANVTLTSSSFSTDHTHTLEGLSLAGNADITFTGGSISTNCTHACKSSGAATFAHSSLTIDTAIVTSEANTNDSTALLQSDASTLGVAYSTITATSTSGTAESAQGTVTDLGGNFFDPPYP